MADPAPVEAAQPAHDPAVVVGWVLAEPLDTADEQGARVARQRVLEQLQEEFPQFRWRMPLIRRQELVTTLTVQPADLIDAGMAERDLGGWDFCFVVTESDLNSYFRPYALATPAQSAGVAVISTARLDPERFDDSVSERERIRILAQRISALALHLLGHLNDVDHSEDPGDFMFNFDTVTDLDRPMAFGEHTRERLAEELRDVADLRMEERPEERQSGAFKFYLRTMWHNRMDILGAVLDIRPWMFPYYLNRLTTAACSTLVVLLITAEAWDLGMSQTPLSVGVLSGVALLGTSFYVVKRQRLLMRRQKKRLTEQTVVTRISIAMAVVIGMATTYLMLFLITLALSKTIFSRDLLNGWAASIHGHILFRHYLLLAGFVAAMGIIVGALGASFEARGLFRHVAYVDEET